MAQVSSTVLQGLAQPSFGGGMFELGSALGGIPGQRREKQKQEKFNEIMKRGQAAMSSAEPDPVVLSGIAQELSALGYTKEAQQFAIKASERSKQVEQAGMFTGKVPGTPEYNEALAQSQMAQGKFAEAGATAAANVKAQEEKETRTRLMGTALQTAKEKFKDKPQEYAREASLITSMSTEALNKYLRPTGQWKSLGGDSNTLYNAETGEFKTVTPGDAGSTPLLEPEEIAKLAKEKLIDMDSFLEFAKGGFTDYTLLKTTGKDGKETNFVASSLQSTDNVLLTIDKAVDLTGDYWRVTYDVGKYLPVGDSRPLANKVQTLKANLAFDRLQKMRDESETGGALGQVSNTEIGLLESSVAALDPASPDFKEQLQTVRRHYENFKAALLGQKPPSDRYVEDEGILYYLDDDGNYVNIGEM